MTVIRDNELYRELSIPFESVDVANESLQKFCEELYELRKKYRIRELLFVMRVGCKRDDGEEADATVVNHFGASIQMEGIAAYAYGTLAARRQQYVQDEIEEATRAIKPPKSRR
jgi:hypothetical protein